MAKEELEAEPMHVSLAIPDPLRGSGRLFLWAQDPGSFQTLKGLARSGAMPLDAYAEESCLAVHVDQSAIISFLTLLRKELAEEQLKHTRAVFKPGQGEPTLSDFPRADTLKNFIIFARGKWLGEILADNRLLVHYQPIVYAADTSIVYGHEALARARTREGEIIEPLRMLSAARDAGLQSVFDVAIHKIAVSGMADSRSPGRLFVNLSPRTAADPTFQLEHFRSLCRIYRMSPSSLVFELTEGDTISDASGMLSFVREAQADGFAVALDDLGAGFSNLNLIHQLRPDIVKLDMNLTRDIHADEFKAVIAQKIIELAHQLEIKVVAEGVEAAEELDWLRENGAHLVQGFLIGRPDELPRDTLDIKP